METKKEPMTEAEKVVEKKRQKAEQQIPKGARQITPEEQRFIDSWCIGMRPVDQALYVLNLARVVQKLAAEAQERQKSGLVKPDGSKI